MAMFNLTKSFEINGSNLLATSHPLVGYNFDWPLGRTLYSYLVEWAAVVPDKIAAIDIDNSTITYAALLARTHQRARRLKELQAAGRFVISQRSRTLECLIDIVSCNAIGAIFIPVDPAWPEARREYIRSITDSVVVLTDEDRSTAGDEKSTSPRLRLVLEDPFDTPSYCLFTSGSTGMPKGAIVSQAGMMNHLYTKMHLLGLDPDSVMLQTAPTTFDVAIWQFCVALLGGGTVRVVANEVAQDPFKLVSLLSSERITHIELVPTILRELVRMAGPDHYFPDLQFMVVTGEELPLRLANDWTIRFPDVPLINAYGPTECADDVTHAIIDAASLASGTVPIGVPIPNTSLYVLDFVDGAWQSVPQGSQGELFVAGSCVGLGYIGEPGKTAEVFAEIEGYPFRIYRTGDLVHQRSDGQLMYGGRVDRQVKISGVRIEPSEIESRILHEMQEVDSVAVVKYHPLVRENRAIVTRETTEPFMSYGDAQLAAFYLLGFGQTILAEDLDAHSRTVLPGPMCPSRWYQLTEVPTSPNGKVDTKVLERWATELSSAEKAVANASQAGTAILNQSHLNTDSFLAVVQDVLGHPVQQDMTFVESGGDSLRAIQLVNVLRSSGCTVRVSELLSGQTLGELADEHPEQLRSQRDVFISELRAGVQTVKLPITCEMSLGQQGIYFQWLLEPDSAYYNYQVLLECPDGLDVDRTRRSLGQALEANPQLMAQFEVDSEGNFVQTFPVSTIMIDKIPVHDVVSEEEARSLCRKRAAVPFDLEQGPSIDVEEFRIQDSSTWFVLTMNEILIDGWGAMKFMEQLSFFYRSEDETEQKEAIAKSAVAVVDFFRNLDGKSGLTREARAFWARSLEGAGQRSPLRESTNISCDPYAAAIVEVSLREDATEAIRTMSRSLQTTPFAVFVATYALALATISELDDFVIGAPVAGREQEDGTDVPTLMLNMVAIRVQLGREEKIVETMQRLATSTNDAISFSASPFSSIVSEFATHSNDDPLFNTMVNMLTYPTSEAWVGAESLRLVELDTGFTKYDASLYIQQHGDDYTLQIAYKLAHVSQERARKVLALTAWFLTSDLLSNQKTANEIMAAALQACDSSKIVTLPIPDLGV